MNNIRDFKDDIRRVLYLDVEFSQERGIFSRKC